MNKEEKSIAHHPVLQGLSYNPLQYSPTGHSERNSGWKTGRHCVIWKNKTLASQMHISEKDFNDTKFFIFLYIKKKKRKEKTLKSLPWDSCSLWLAVIFYQTVSLTVGFPGGSVVKNPTANAGDTFDPRGQEDPLEEEISTYTCLGNPMYRGIWWATIHGLTKNEVQLSD